MARDGKKEFKDLPETVSVTTSINGNLMESMDLNVFNNDNKQCVQLISDGKFACMRNPEKCLQGFTVSFWLKLGGKYFVAVFLEMVSL